MALGRPGLEPCVPLEVRFGVVIDQRSGDAHIQAEAQCRVRFTAHCGLRECSKRFPELFTCFFTFFLNHLTPDPRFHSHPIYSAASLF